jgi:aminobenzoyl-glutamate utilization protein B
MASLDIISKFVKENEEDLKKLHHELWENPEGSFHEYKTSALLIQAFKAAGFSVNSGIGDMPTAFTAEWGSGKPVIAIATDLDALPGLSQERANPEYNPIPNQTHGHGCGHSAISAGAYSAVLAVQAWLKETGASGTIRFLGCPAEEGGAGKVFLIRAGVFDDIDVVLTWHPGTGNGAGGHRMISIVAVDYEFFGSSAHAALEPHLGRSALDAAELMNIGVNYLREHMLSNARVHYAYGDAGGKAANVVQNYVKLHYIIRAPQVDDVAELLERVNDISRGAALMTGTSVKNRVTSSTSDVVPNATVSKIISDAYVAVGPPPFDDEDFKIARQFFSSLSDVAKQSAINRLTAEHGKERAEEIIRTKPLATGINVFKGIEAVYGTASTDFGDVTHIVPSGSAGASLAAIGTPIHSWQFTAQAGSVLGDKAILTIGKVLALAAASLYSSPEAVKAAWDEFHHTITTPYRSLLPADAKPNIT